MLKHVPWTLLIPMIMAACLGIMFSSEAIRSAENATSPTPSPLVPISLCFTTIVLVSGTILQLHKRIVDLESQVAKLQSKDEMDVQ